MQLNADKKLFLSSRNDKTASFYNERKASITGNKF
jgi:hypothetical protein